MKIKIPSVAIIILLTAFITLQPVMARPQQAVAVTYYVSSSTGNDSYNGLSEGAPFATVSKVNSLDLQPGDRVLFKCGDTWRVDPLYVSESGLAGQPLTFGSYPVGCVNRPIFSGAQPITGWALHSGNIYVANLTAGSNAGKFAYGINQLFRGETRLLLGRWPNLDAIDGGYSTIDAYPAANQLTDSQLPAGNWAGAVAHIRGMRWYILNRQVTASASQTLTLGANAGCWGGNCTGWGFFLNNHLSTLDHDGEWYYDTTSQKIYFYSGSGVPANGQIEGSVVLKTDDRSWGGINLGKDLTGQGIAYVTVENLDLRRWFRSGIVLPTNFAHYEPHHLVIRNNQISDVDAKGIDLATWVYEAQDDRPDGWRGGYELTVSGNTIERANSMGINTYSRNSSFSENVILDIARIENLGAAGMGCGFAQGDASGGICTEDGDGIRIKVDKVNDSGNSLTFWGNHLERIGHNGFDVFGFGNTFTHNVIMQACISKGDCGGVRTFGSGSLASSPVHDLTFNTNLIVDTIGNTDGCHSTYDAQFGFGLYLDNYSRNVTVTGNTIINSTVHGILFQNSTGIVTNNVLYNNGRTYPYGGAQVYVGASPASVSTQTGNILYSLNPNAWTLALNNPAVLGTSNNNYFFSPYKAGHISASGAKSLAQWQSSSGKDGASDEHWFTLASGDPPNSQIFYNETSQVTTVSLGSTIYKDLDQNLIWDSLTLQPYQSKVLISVSTKFISGNAGVSEALIAYTGGSTIADGTGDYSFQVLQDWSGTVIPSKTGYTFSPASRTYNSVQLNQTGQNYTATPVTYTISGNAGAAGVTLGYTDGSPKIATTDASGNYSLTVSYNWSGTVTPELNCYTFSPTSRPYSNVLANQTAQNYIPSTPDPACKSIAVSVAGINKGNYYLSSGGSTRQNYTGENAGPAHVTSNDDSTSTIASIRILYGGVSYSEMMGFPDSQVTNAYIFPYYNNVAMNSQLRVSNLGDVSTTINVYLGSDPTPIDTYTLAADEATRKTYAGRNDGPMRVTSSATNILSTIRVLYAQNSYSELLGYPVNQLTNNYLFPYYNNVAMNSQLRVSNLGGVDTTVNVYLADDPTPIDSYSLAAGTAVRKTYAGANSGPLRVTSSATNILTSIRVLYAENSYSELMGFPSNQLAQEYWYPVYDNVSLNSQLRVSNVGSGPTAISIYFGDDPTPIDTYTLAAGEAVRKTYAGYNGGPLRVVSGEQPIMSTVRTVYGGNSYYEMAGLPNTWLSTQYWFPWYNNVAMVSELRIAVPQ